MKKILIVYHTQSGNTLKLANAILNGAKSEDGVEVKMKKALESDADDLLWCDAVIFGTPENFGYMSGGLKLFFDETYYQAKEKQPNLNISYAIFISCENNGSGAVFQIEQIVSGYPLKKSLAPLVIKGEIKKNHLEDAFEFGKTIAAGLIYDIF